MGRPQNVRTTINDTILIIGSGCAGTMAANRLRRELSAGEWDVVCVDREPPARFDGHANCFIETGAGKGMMIDFSYDVEALPGVFPFPGIGPFSLLRETRLNHWGKVLFHTAYWHLLLPGRPVPLPNGFTMRGKKAPRALQ